MDRKVAIRDLTTGQLHLLASMTSRSLQSGPATRARPPGLTFFCVAADLHPPVADFKPMCELNRRVVRKALSERQSSDSAMQPVDLAIKGPTSR